MWQQESLITHRWCEPRLQGASMICVIEQTDCKYKQFREMLGAFNKPGYLTNQVKNKCWEFGVTTGKQITPEMQLWAGIFSPVCNWLSWQKWCLIKGVFVTRLCADPYVADQYNSVWFICSLTRAFTYWWVCHLWRHTIAMHMSHINQSTFLID